MREIVVSSRAKYELINVTRGVESAVEESGVRDGWCFLFVPHSTGAVIVTEDEPGLKTDVLRWAREVFERDGYEHDRIDDNAHAHVCSAVVGCSRVLPVRDGKLVRGTWQDVFFLETDGPRSRRRVLVEVKA